MSENLNPQHPTSQTPRHPRWFATPLEFYLGPRDGETSHVPVNADGGMICRLPMQGGAYTVFVFRRDSPPCWMWNPAVADLKTEGGDHA